MPPKNIITTTLPEYVDQNRIPLIREVVLEGAVIEHLSLQTGIKHKAALNYFKVDTFLQDGSTCGFNALDTMDLTQREIAVAEIKVNGEICPKTLLGKWAEYEIRTSAVAEAERMPFEEFIAEMVVADVRGKRDLAIWQGDTDIVPTEGDSIEYAKSRFDGFIKLADEDDATIKRNIVAGVSAYNIVKTVLAAVPARFRKDTKVFVSPEFFFAFTMDLVEKNFYHYSGPQDQAPTELVFPGTRNRVIEQPGLSGALYVYASQTENMFFGTDLENDVEEIKIWFSNDDDVWRYKVQFTAGVQTAFPDRVVLAVLAENPDATGGASIAEGVAAIANATQAIAENTGAEGALDTAIKGISDAITDEDGVLDQLEAIATNTGEDGALDSGLQEITDAISGTEADPDAPQGE